MDGLLKAVRDTLIGDATLIGLVPAADITSSFNPEQANYPSVSLGIETGGSFSEISGVTRARVIIDIYSDVNKQEAWTIYDRIKALLHGQERSITDGSRLIHSIYESHVIDSQFDFEKAAWRITAQYEILFSTTGLTITTGASGSIYADASVTAVSGKEIAKFRGAVSLRISYEFELQTESERFAKAAWFRKGIAILTMEEVMFKAASINLLWSITHNASDTLADGSTAATSELVTQASTPMMLQVLFQAVKTDDGKKLEIEADKAFVPLLNIPFPPTDFARHNCEWYCLGNSSGNIVKVSVEN